MSDEQDINYSIVSKNTEKFSKIEAMLYDKFPKYIESENYFFVGEKKINRNKTLEQNNINNNDIITLKMNDFESN
jgi:predicted transcriptional regulator